MIEYDIIGGPEDGHKVYTTKRPPQVTIHLSGVTYMSIQFAKTPGSKEQVFAYMVCGDSMTPQEAMAIWRLRHKKGELMR